MSKPILQVVITSTRPHRVGVPIAQWFVEQARKHGAFEVELTDLAELDLPLMNEPKHPRLQDYQHEYTKNWSRIIERSSAIVFVMPEYNHSFSSAMKNAVDYLFREWAYKPVSFVSYGGVSGGVRAIESFLPIAAALKMIAVREQVMIPFAAGMLEDGKFVPNQIIEESATMALDELAKMEKVTQQLR